ncbi:hypothetical protein [Streptomyces vinaceus]|uniref:hypothetical protein n=1 Tax=Streptomyces vinaceus TaxID=1960 RepID=UPI0037FF44AC
MPELKKKLREPTPAGPGHPWTGAEFSSAWGTRAVLDTTLVQPGLAAEIGTNTSIDRGGVSGHPIRYVRLRLDATPADIPRFDVGPAAAAG